MSGHESVASEDLAAQTCLDSDNKRTLPHDAEPDADIHSESDEEPGAQIHSENRGKPDAEIQSESYEEPVPHIHSESSEDLVAEIHSESYEDPVPDIHSEGKRKPDAEIQSESYEEPVPEIHSESEREPVTEIPSKSERETVPGIPSKNKRDPVPEIPSQSEIEPVPEIPSTSKREPIAEIPSKSEKEPAPEIPSKSERKPRLKKILTESERDSDAKSDDGQQRLPGPSLYGEKPRRWISEEEWLNIIKEDAHVREKPRRWISEEEWLNIMKEDPRVRLKLWSDVAIFKIPDFLKDTKREAYVPQKISFGPYHHGSAELTAMDHYKARALRNRRTRFNIQMTLDRDVVAFANNARKAILKREDEIRDSYEESIDCDGNTLAMILTLDGCFILEVLKTLDERGFIDDSIFGENMVSASNTLKDILMLENQIPWIVLLELLRLENPKDDHVRTLLNVMVKGTCGLLRISSEDRTALLQLDWLGSANPNVHHLLGFVHRVIVHRPSNQANPGNEGEHRISIERCIGGCLQMLADKNKALNHDFESIPPAVELKNAGIRFRPCNGGIGQIDFDLDSSTIYLPLLSITDDTEVLFRNLIAFEMCRPSELNYVSGYVNLMDDLIDSQKDVAFLRSMGILTNPLGSDKEVAGLFNGLFKGVSAVRMPNIFDGLRKEVNANYKNRIANYKNRIRVQLALALAVAFAVLCLTIIQRIYTVKK